MNYYYFVSGIVSSECLSKFFNAEICVTEKISSANHIKSIKEALAKIYEVTPEQIIIFNFQLLRIE